MAGRIAPIDVATFLVFVFAIIVWLALGSWGASILTRKKYLSPDSPQVARGSDVVRRVGPSSVSPQMVLAFIGPILLIIAVVLPKRS
jgi:hypothetical protein